MRPFPSRRDVFCIVPSDASEAEDEGARERRSVAACSSASVRSGSAYSSASGRSGSGLSGSGRSSIHDIHAIHRGAAPSDLRPAKGSEASRPSGPLVLEVRSVTTGPSIPKRSEHSGRSALSGSSDTPEHSGSSEASDPSGSSERKTTRGIMDPLLSPDLPRTVEPTAAWVRDPDLRS
jgi:hypothetical protein